MRYNDTQKVRDAIEATGLLSVGGSGPIYNDARANGTHRIKLAQAGYFPTMPLSIQWHIYDNLRLFFGERLVSVKLKPNSWTPWYAGRQDDWSLCVVVKDYR